MRILMVSIYAPARDGIAAYAIQTVKRLRAEGHDVEVLSPGPSAAHHHLDLRGPRGALALARRVRGYDRVIVQFHPDIFFPAPTTRKERLRGSAALMFAFRTAKHLELRVHEVDYRWGHGSRPDAVAVRAMFRAVDSIVVHTEKEADDFTAAFGVDRTRVVVTAHGADFVRRVQATRDEARTALGIPTDEFMFLGIGFIQPHKGFDRAVAAFRGMPAGHRVDIVGSVRVEEPAFVRHVDELRELCDQTPGAHLHAGYLSDDDFDRWIVAADVVVLPYRSIWSSGVLERALLYDRPVIATRVGGLDAQAAGRAGVTIIEDDDRALAAVMRSAASLADRPTWRGVTSTTREAVMAEIRARASGGRVVAGETEEPDTANTAALRAEVAVSELADRVDALSALVVGSEDIHAGLFPDGQSALPAWRKRVLRHLADGPAAVAARPRLDVAEVQTDVGALLFPAWDEVVLPALRDEGRWEPEEGEWLRARLRPGMVVVDVGANVGYHALLTAAVVGESGRVIAIEPEPLNYALLCANITRNDRRNVTPINAAAGDATGVAELTRASDNAGDHRAFRRSGATDDRVVRVPMLALDDLLPATLKSDIVIIDTQGYDHRVIRGMAKHLERCRPSMLVEFWIEGIEELGDDPATIIEGYRDLDYSVTVLDAPDVPATAVAEEIVEVARRNRGGYVSLVLEPRSR